MLKYVHLKNLALIEETEIEFTDGLNILTGETGSGKSVIISAINLALGSRADRQLIRSGASFGLAELLFTAPDERALEMLDRLGISRDADNILITRKISPEASVSKVNGENVTLANLKKITSLLVDVHGQHDHQSLLDPSKHMEIIDEFGAGAVTDVKNALSAELSRYRALREEFKSYDKDDVSLEREISLLEYEAGEIEEAALLCGEDAQLEEEYKTLAALQKTWNSLNRLKSLFDDETDGIIQKSSCALREADEAIRINPSLAPFKETLTDIDSLVKDFGHDINAYISANSFDIRRFAEISARLNLINRLKSRYGETIEDILAYQNACKIRLDEYADFSENRERLLKDMNTSRAKINALARELSAVRQSSARSLEPLIAENLEDLNFLDVEFRTGFETAPKISKEGYDRVSFMISLNPGEPLKPLASVASGGELSRIMLALKSALADRDSIETLIFDEIDTGISGNTAAKAAEKLKGLSRSHQIICITHLPQIAAKADSHFLIEKEVSDGSTISGIRKLDEEEAVTELARMISGNEITQAALDHARELKE